MAEGGIMAEGWRNFSKQNRCPICGGPDWCGWKPLENSGRVILCFRDTQKETFENCGMVYKYTKDSSGGASVYCEFEVTNDHGENRRTLNKGAYLNKELMAVDMVDPAPAMVLDILYRKLQEILVLEDAHRKYLHEQGWTDEMIEYYHVVSFPEKDDLRRKYNNHRYKNKYRSQICNQMITELKDLLGEDCLKGMPGAYRTSSGKWTLYGPSGILFPVFDGNGRIIRLRLRKDFEDVNGKIYGTEQSGRYFFDPESKEKTYISMKGCYRLVDNQKQFLDSHGKYRYLHSFLKDYKAEKEGKLKNLLNDGVMVPNIQSVYTRPSDDKSVWFICEGEPKSIYANWVLERPFVDIPGVGSWKLAVSDEMISYMKGQGMKAVCVAFDADQFDMISHRNVRLFAINLMLHLMECNVIALEAVWDEKVAKGLDDLLAAGGFPDFRTPKKEDLLAEKEKIQSIGHLMTDNIV